MSEKSELSSSKKSLVNLSLPLAIVLIFGGCCNNVISFESLIHSEYTQIKNITTFITFIQILYIIIENIPFYTKNHKKFKIPLKRHLISTILFLLGTWLNNSVFKFKGITVPYHIIMKSLNILINMALGSIILKKKYTSKQIITCVFLTLGCIIACIYQNQDFQLSDVYNLKATLFSLLPRQRANQVSIASKIDYEFISGISILLLSSVLISLLQIYNNKTYEKYGKDTWKEVMIYQHILSLPFIFLLNTDTINSNCKFLIKNVGFKNSFLLKLFINCITQSLCVRGVNLLASNLTKDTFLLLNIVLNSRKLVSLILSCWVFDNHMSFTSYVGCIITFISCFIYTAL